ncbi:MAG: histidinol-phosphate transaminase [Nitrososphaerales archaeon]
MTKWIKAKVASLAKVSGYQKPERYTNVIRLDTNENLAVPKSFVSRIVRDAATRIDMREYPSDQYDELRAELGKYLNLPKECIAVGSGSDQIIDLLLSTFANGFSTLTLEPTFTFYKDRCKLRSIGTKELPLDANFSFDAKKLMSMSKGTRICYICSPNNPTGNQFDRNAMLEVISSFDGLVIVDEAYVEFADYSLKDVIRRYDNLVVLRTMSKAFSLAGARVGYMISNVKIADLFVNTIQYPYPLSSLSLKAASIALSKLGYIKRSIRSVKKERERVFNEINLIDGYQAFRSDANFIMFEAGSRYQIVYKALIRKGIVIRKIGDVGKYEGCLRVTIGTQQMNNKFLKALKVVKK